jgi:DNA primase
MPDDLENIVEQIQSKLDIADIIGSYIPLKRAGRNFKACCPFHHEKTPSFVVSPVKGIYHCFGCGAGGDMISFIMKHVGLDFIEALNFLADKAGVTIPKNKAGLSSSRRQKGVSSSLCRANELAAEYYSAVLIGSRRAVSARKYLVNRGLKAGTVALFKIGYAPEEWDGLLRFAKSKGVSETSLEKAGLIIPGKNNGYYDRFRSRIMFPIYDVRSKIVAFGGRVIGDSMPKYMNSPETEAYIKGRHLYGLNFAINEIREKDYAVVVEGYMDLVVPFQYGIKNITATLGTALTVEQARLIKRFTSNVVIIYDADEAGEAASLRGLDLLVSEGLFVKIASLPKGDDPDSFARKHGGEALLKIIESASSLFDYKLKLLLNKFNPAESEDKAKITSEMLPTIKRVDNGVLRADYIKRLCATLFIPEEVIAQELARTKADRYYQAEEKIVKTHEAIRPAEKIIISLMMEDPEIASQVRSALCREEFTNPDIRLILDVIYSMLDENQIPNERKVINRVDERLGCIVYEALEETEKVIDRGKTLLDCIQRIKKDNMIQRKRELTCQIKQAEAKGDDAVLMNLVKQLDTLESERV